MPFSVTSAACAAQSSTSHRRCRPGAYGQLSVRSREADQRDEEIARMNIKIGDISIENELLRERARRAECRGRE